MELRAPHAVMGRLKMPDPTVTDLPNERTRVLTNYLLNTQLVQDRNKKEKKNSARCVMQLRGAMFSDLAASWKMFLAVRTFGSDLTGWTIFDNEYTDAKYFSLLCSHCKLFATPPQQQRVCEALEMAL